MALWHAPTVFFYLLLFYFFLVVVLLVVVFFAVEADFFAVEVAAVLPA